MHHTRSGLSTRVWWSHTDKSQACSWSCTLCWKGFTLYLWQSNNRKCEKHSKRPTLTPWVRATPTLWSLLMATCLPVQPCCSHSCCLVKSLCCCYPRDLTWRRANRDHVSPGSRRRHLGRLLASLESAKKKNLIWLRRECEIPGENSQHRFQNKRTFRVLLSVWQLSKTFVASKAETAESFRYVRLWLISVWRVSLQFVLQTCVCHVRTETSLFPFAHIDVHFQERRDETHLCSLVAGRGWGELDRVVLRYRFQVQLVPRLQVQDRNLLDERTKSTVCGW